MPGKPRERVDLFEAKGAADIYSALFSKLRARVGARLAVEDPKKTCVHFVAGEGGTAFAGAHPRIGAVLLNIRTQAPLKSKRVRKVEQVSKNRCHCEVLLESATDVDGELLGWLEAAADLASTGSTGTAVKSIKNRLVGASSVPRHEVGKASGPGTLIRAISRR